MEVRDDVGFVKPGSARHLLSVGADPDHAACGILKGASLSDGRKNGPRASSQAESVCVCACVCVCVSV